MPGTAYTRGRCGRGDGVSTPRPPLTLADVTGIANAFQIHGAPHEVRPHGRGHINDSYRVSCSQDGRAVDYLLQRINPVVFPDPPALMHNVSRICTHLASICG